MHLEKRQIFSDITLRLNSLTSVLCGYCECFSENSQEISHLLEFTRILKNTAYELYDLF